MPWSRLDDTWYDHAKLMRLPDRLRNAAAGLRDRALSWSNRHLADGHIPDAVLRTLDCTPDLRAALITVGLFEEEPGGIYIHDYPAFNESKAEIIARRERAAIAGRMGGLAKHRASGSPSTQLSGQLSGQLSTEPVIPSQVLSETLTNARGQNARPVPVPVPVDSSSQAPSVLPARALARLRNGSPQSLDPRLTVEQFEAWQDFTADAWRPFKEAWLSRGLLWPPSGEPTDDDTSQRGLLFQVASARPNDLGRWVRESPERSAHGIIAHVLRQWHGIRELAGIEEPEPVVLNKSAAKRRMQQIGAVLRGDP